MNNKYNRSRIYKKYRSKIIKCNKKYNAKKYNAKKYNVKKYNAKKYNAKKYNVKKYNNKVKGHKKLNNKKIKQIINISSKPITTNEHYLKEHIPKRVRELVWTTYNGKVFSCNCYVTWCDNKLNVFNFQVGHDLPESKGGTLDIDNLKPICSNCNLSMGNKYTITEWNKLVVVDNNT